MFGDNFFVLIIGVLAILAIVDLVVGVSNDAVNFLNSAIGSKVLSFRNIMIIASLGILFGTLFSGGIMEVARKGIFVPSEFYFDEIMVIFLTVMITDILLLEFFNTIGIPTSTTVSIVFELLGAAFCMAFIKTLSKGEELSSIFNYINTSKASHIIIGIVLSVVIAFVIGALVQFFVRLILTFKFESRPKYISVIFGGLATTSIVYFMLIKGLKGVTFIDVKYMIWTKSNSFLLLLIILPLLTLFSWIFVVWFRKNIYKFIIIIGTFSLAMAFAGNDLINFIGVPIAGWQSYEAWKVSGVSANIFDMSILQGKVRTPLVFLLLSGLVMVLTLWFSTKAQAVVKTSIDLSDQNDIKERFKPNILSRAIVRIGILLSNFTNKIIPKGIRLQLDNRFTRPVEINLSKKRKLEIPAFDQVRAAVNLMVSGILISLATSIKLPLSTTYVTFMVAMGTSFSDRAWGVDSAVYRIAGVLNVIGSWFLTAVIAFTATVILAYLIYLGGETTVSILLIAIVFILIKNYIKHNTKLKIQKIEDQLDKLESNTIQDIIKESVSNVSKLIHRSSKIYNNTIQGLSIQDPNTLKKSKKGVDKIEQEVEDLQNSIFYFIRNMDEPALESSRFYILITRYFQDLAKSVRYIADMSYKHIMNNHKGLTFKQINDFKEVKVELSNLLNRIENTFKNTDFVDTIEDTIIKQEHLDKLIDKKIESQIIRTKDKESSPKNTKLYFSILLETKDFIGAITNLLQLYSQKNKVTSDQ